MYGWKYPWYGVLIHAETGRPNCGANLISTKHLLTAAHCYDDYREFRFGSASEVPEQPFDRIVTLQSQASTMIFQ